MFTRNFRVYKFSAKGFTLAEVLITLGIIGIVAAMTIPTLIENQRNKEFEVQLKKVYSELNQVAKLYLEENEEPIPTAIANRRDSMHKILLKYIKGTTVIDTNIWNSKDEEGNSTFENYAKYTTLGGQHAQQICDISGVRSDLSGRAYYYNDSPKSGDNGPLICVDLNGSKRPNISGIDYFIFIFTVDGTVIPMGEDHQNNAYGNSTGANFAYKFSDKPCPNSFGWTCAYYAIKDISPNGKGTYWKDYINKKMYK